MEDLRSALRLFPDLMASPAATPEAHRVYLIEYGWYRKFCRYMSGNNEDPPGMINNIKIWNPMERRIKFGLKENRDFIYISNKSWQIVKQYFSCDIQIVVLLVSHPETNVPTLLFSFKRVQIFYKGQEKNISSDPSWTFHQVNKQLCNALKIDHKAHEICLDSSPYEFSMDMTVKSFYTSMKGTLVLREVQAVFTTQTPQPVGMTNLGNTCFFNSAVQALVRVKPLTDYVLSPDFLRNLNRSNKKGTNGEVAMSYREFLNELCTTKRKYVDPTPLRATIVKHYKRFANYKQHDASEMLGALLDALHEDLNQSHDAGGHLPPSPTKRSDDSWHMHIAKNSSPIMDIFHGSLETKIVCMECGYDKSVYDPFMFLSLPIATRMFRKVTLDMCYQKFTEPEVLDGDNMWKCPHCKKKVKAQRTISVSKCSSILIVVLNRFVHSQIGYSKIDCNIEYPDILEGEPVGDSNKRYQLIGVVMHFGGMYSGHYVATAMDPDTKKWYHFNDSSVSECSASSAHSENAYILLYQKVK